MPTVPKSNFCFHFPSSISETLDSWIKLSLTFPVPLIITSGFPDFPSALAGSPGSSPWSWVWKPWELRALCSLSLHMLGFIIFYQDEPQGSQGAQAESCKDVKEILPGQIRSPQYAEMQS